MRWIHSRFKIYMLTESWNYEAMLCLYVSARMRTTRMIIDSIAIFLVLSVFNKKINVWLATELVIANFIAVRKMLIMQSASKFLQNIWIKVVKLIFITLLNRIVTCKTISWNPATCSGMALSSLVSSLYTWQRQKSSAYLFYILRYLRSVIDTVPYKHVLENLLVTVINNYCVNILSDTARASCNNIRKGVAEARQVSRTSHTHRISSFKPFYISFAHLGYLILAFPELCYKVDGSIFHFCTRRTWRGVFLVCSTWYWYPSCWFQSSVGPCRTETSCLFLTCM